MARALAFSLFVCAAFAWVPPFIDRGGLAALGFAFLALTVGRVSGLARATIFGRTPLAAPDSLDGLDGLGSDLQSRLAPYLTDPNPADRGSS